MRQLRPSILLFGAGGRVGRELRRSLATLGNVVASVREDLDLRNTDAVIQKIRALEPTWIVNASAYTNVDRAEIEPDLAFALNQHAVQAMAIGACEVGSRLLHISTDYVFDGQKSEPYVETDAVNPINVYGQSKAAGEKSLFDSECEFLILRTSWVYSTVGNSFPKAILSLALEGKRIEVVSDQKGAPVNAAYLADICAFCIHSAERQHSGSISMREIYHATSPDFTSWFEISKHVLDSAKKHGIPIKTLADEIQPVSLVSRTNAADRPVNSCLDSAKLSRDYGLVLPDWREDLFRLVREVQRGS